MVCLNTLASGQCRKVFNLSGCLIRQCAAAARPRSSPSCNAVAANLPSNNVGQTTPPDVNGTGAIPAQATSMGKLCLKDMTFEELEEWCVGLGEKASRAMQLWRYCKLMLNFPTFPVADSCTIWCCSHPTGYRFMYYDGQWIRGFHETIGIQNGLSKAFADQADHIATCEAGLHLQSVHTSDDGTRKLLFSIAGEEVAQVETVLIPVIRKQVKPRLRVTSPD